jgi:hypothetical protein
VDGTGSGSCPMEGFGISCVEPSVTTMLVTVFFLCSSSVFTQRFYSTSGCEK